MMTSFAPSITSRTVHENNISILSTPFCSSGLSYGISNLNINDSTVIDDNLAIHQHILGLTSNSQDGFFPIYYLSLTTSDNTLFVNSSDGPTISVSECYERIERQLNQLGESDDDDNRIQEGAVASALTVVQKLRSYNLSPPAISWHGGDAVVMLWALGNATYAITVTDGELGYVVRRDQKCVKMADSVSLEALKLSDLR